MKPEDYYNHEYSGRCDRCKTIYFLTTQRDYYPEYHTKVYLRCHACAHEACEDQFIEFILPVN